MLVIAAFSAAASAPEQYEWPDGAVTGIRVEKSESMLIVNMDINPACLPLKANRECWLRPAITAGADTLMLDPVVVAGRTRYYQHRRARDINGPAILLRDTEKMPYRYHTMVPMQEWMEYSSVILQGEIDGCCGSGLGILPTDELATIDYRDFTIDPEMIYISPAKEIEKTRSVTGNAYIDFPVNQTVIYPDYRRNPQELAAIRATIDEIRSDSDVTITSISFKGFASPEGSYANNERLAKGRTEALIDYVRNLYSFPSSVMHASWEAEDWSGLEARLRGLDIPNRDAMLAVVSDPDLTPDRKDAKLKQDFPEQYRYLLSDVYPALRHSDYRVEYRVRNFYDVKEIAAVMATAPQKLSLDELFLYAQTLDKDSPEFREVMEVAVRMYPSDPEANLNASTSAISSGDLDKAGKYLEKAADSPVAVYNAGVIAAMRQDFDRALTLLKEAEQLGISQASPLINVVIRRISAQTRDRVNSKSE